MRTQQTAGKTLRAVIYTRVSTGEQAEHGTSLEAQELACLRKAAEMGAQVVAIHKDPGVSGALYLARPGIQAALAALEAGAANVLIIHKLDRSGRDVEVVRDIAKRVQRAGAELVFADGMSYSNNATGKLMLTQMAGFAEFEKEMIKERTSRGRRGKAEKGVQPSRARSPYGYHIFTKADKIRGDCPDEAVGTYQIVEEQAKWVREIFTRYAAGDSLLRICRFLHEAGVPTARPETSAGAPQWRETAITRILSNPAYKGEPLFGVRQTVRDEAFLQQGQRNPYISRQRPEEDWVKLSAPPIVDAAIWEGCQERLKDAKSRFGGNPKRTRLLTGLLRCPTCGRRMAPLTYDQKNNQHVYCCPDYHRACNAVDHVCNSTRHNGRQVDELVCSALLHAASNPESVREAVRDYRAAASQERTVEDPQTRDLARLRGEMDALARKETAAVEAQIAGIMAGASPAVYTTALAALAKEREALQARIDRVEKALAPSPRAIQLPDPGETAALAAAALADLETVLTSEVLFPGEKRKCLAIVIEKILPLAEVGSYEVTLQPFPGSAQTLTSIRLVGSSFPPGRGRL